LNATQRCERGGASKRKFCEGKTGTSNIFNVASKGANNTLHHRGEERLAEKTLKSGGEGGFPGKTLLPKKGSTFVPLKSAGTYTAGDHRASWGGPEPSSATFKGGTPELHF